MSFAPFSGCWLGSNCTDLHCVLSKNATSFKNTLTALQMCQPEACPQISDRIICNSLSMSQLFKKKLLHGLPFLTVHCWFPPVLFCLLISLLLCGAPFLWEHPYSSMYSKGSGGSGSCSSSSILGPWAETGSTSSSSSSLVSFMMIIPPVCSWWQTWRVSTLADIWHTLTVCLQDAAGFMTNLNAGDGAQ